MLRKALFFSFTSNYLSMGIQFLSVMVITRLLTPEEMGAFSIAASFIILAQVLRDFGVSQYIIQEKELTEERIRAAFSLTLIFGWSLSFLIYIGSTSIGNFYNAESITKILHVLAINFLVLPFGAITLSLLRRDMNFKSKMIIESASAMVRASVAIYLAYLGFSYMSLAYASLADALTTVVFASFFRRRNLSFLPGLKQVGHVFKTGWKLAGTTFLSYTSTAMAELILGKTLGLNAVGFYSRATATISIFDKLITSALRPVVFPYFSAEHRSGNNVGTLFVKGTQLFTIVAWPFFIFLGYYSLPIVRLLYGDQWDAAAPVVKYLCIYTILGSLSYLVDPLMTATGRAANLLRLYSITLPIRLALILVFSSMGLEAVALSLSLLPILRFIILGRYVRKDFGLTFKNYFHAIIANVYIAILIFFICIGMDLLLNSAADTSIPYLIFTFITTVTVWLITILLVKHPIYDEIINIMNQLTAKRAP